MGLFDKLRGKEAGKHETAVPKIDWISLTEPGQLTAIAKQTAKTSVLFKHSTRCGISNAVLKQFESKNEALNETFIQILNTPKANSRTPFYEQLDKLLIKKKEKIKTSSNDSCTACGLSNFFCLTKQ